MDDLPPFAVASSRGSTAICIDLGLVKAQPMSDPWDIFIQASSPRVDLAGEIVLPQALQKALPPFLEHGTITWEHITATTRADPSVLIGEPKAARFNAAACLLVHGHLYEYQPKAQNVMHILKSGGRVRASVGGQTISRTPASAGKPATIDELWLNHIALTPWPMNGDTGVQLTPYAEFLAKAMGVAEAAPMVPEDLGGAPAHGQLSPEFVQRWHMLTEVLLHLAESRGTPFTVAKARQRALAILLKRREVSKALVAPHVSFRATGA